MSSKSKSINVGKSLFPIIQYPTTVSRHSNVQSSVISWTKRITDSGNSGDVCRAVRLFVNMPLRNQASWNAILTVLLRSGHLKFARKVFEQMPYRNSVSHTAMISGLSEWGLVMEARAVFDSFDLGSDCNVMFWTAMISCYSKNGLYCDGLKLFIDSYGQFFALNVLPNSYTFSSVLKCCLEVKSVETAVHIHGLIVKLLDEDDDSCVYVHNTLIDLYSKLVSLADAERIFNGMKWKDLSTWNIMMSVYGRCSMMDKAVEIFYLMTEKDTLSWNILMFGLGESGNEIEAMKSFTGLWNLSMQRPNRSTFAIILTICGKFCLLKWGKSLHTCIVKSGFYGNNIFIGNSMINMYARFGCIEESEQVFNEMVIRDTVSWNSLVLGLGQNGDCIKAIEIAEKALAFGYYNHNTFIGILTSCSHGGLVDEGLDYFYSMNAKYGVEPTLDHCVCLIDMLGRAGKIDEACSFLHSMPFKPNSLAWTTLLSSCMLHNNEEVGKLASEKLKSLEPTNVNSYVMLANLYARTGKDEAYKQVMSSMDEVGLRKEPCRSFIP